MSVSVLVTGKFKNGRERKAGLHWPGTSWAPDFEKRAKEYGQTFKQEIEGAAKNPGEMPTFEYIKLSCINTDYYAGKAVVFQVGGDTRELEIYLALTRGALEKLRTSMPELNGEITNPNVREKLRKCDINKVVVDLTRQARAKNPEVLWSKVRLHADFVYRQAFGSIISGAKRK